MSRQFSVFVVLAKDPLSVPRTYTRHLTSTFYSSSGRFIPLSWHLQEPTDTQTKITFIEVENCVKSLLVLWDVIEHGSGKEN